MEMEDNYSEEIKILGAVYSDLIEALINKPESGDYEIARIYYDNVAARMNNWAAMVNKVKLGLEKRLPVPNLTADNRPA
jgi:hypothetical protein